MRGIWANLGKCVLRIVVCIRDIRKELDANRTCQWPDGSIIGRKQRRRPFSLEPQRAVNTILTCILRLRLKRELPYVNISREGSKNRPSAWVPSGARS